MDRRTFLLNGSQGLACLALSPVVACRSAGEGAAGGHSDDMGPYVVGDRNLVFADQGGGYVLDMNQHRIQAVDEFHLVVGEFGVLGEGSGELNGPIDGAIGPDGRLFVLERGNCRVQVFGADGTHLSSIAGPGELMMPDDLLIRDSQLYVADSLNHRVRVYDLDGTHLQSFGEGVLNGPRGLAFDARGELHVVDTGDASVAVFRAGGDLVRRYGSFGADPGQMLRPRSIVISGGRAFISDPSSGLVHVFDGKGRFEGRFQPVDPDGDAVAPIRLAIQPGGGLYIWTNGQVGHRAGAA